MTVGELAERFPPEATLVIWRGSSVWEEAVVTKAEEGILVRQPIHDEWDGGNFHSLDEAGEGGEKAVLLT